MVSCPKAQTTESSRAERSSNGSWRSHRALQLMDACGVRTGGVRVVGGGITRGTVSELPDVWREQGDKVVYVLTVQKY